MLVVFNLEEICFLCSAWLGSVAIRKGSDQWTPCYFSPYFVKVLYSQGLLECTQLLGQLRTFYKWVSLQHLVFP